MSRVRLRLIIATAVALVILGPLGWLWWASLVPGTYSVMDMGVVDLGGGPSMSGHAGTEMVSVDTLTGPETGDPDVEVTLTADRAQVTLGGGGPVAQGYTLNGTSPGPEIRVTQGDLVQVTLINGSVPDGVTLHWHGVDLPNAWPG